MECFSNLRLWAMPTDLKTKRGNEALLVTCKCLDKFSTAIAFDILANIDKYC